MAIPSIEIPTQALTNADLLALAKYRLAAILAGAQEYATLESTVRHAMLNDVKQLITDLEQKISDEEAGDYGGGNILARLNRSS